MEKMPGIKTGFPFPPPPPPIPSATCRGGSRWWGWQGRTPRQWRQRWWGCRPQPRSSGSSTCQSETRVKVTWGQIGKGLSMYMRYACPFLWRDTVKRCYLAFFEKSLALLSLLFRNFAWLTHRLHIDRISYTEGRVEPDLSPKKKLKFDNKTRNKYVCCLSQKLCERLENATET